MVAGRSTTAKCRRRWSATLTLPAGAMESRCQVVKLPYYMAILFLHGHCQIFIDYLSIFSFISLEAEEGNPFKLLLLVTYYKNLQ